MAAFFEYAGAHFLGQKKAPLLCGSLCDRGRVASVICKALGGAVGCRPPTAEPANLRSIQFHLL